jgi:hypothetical protein
MVFCLEKECCPETWKMKIKLIICGGLFITRFLIGFVPESFKAGELSQKLSAAERRYASCELDSDFSATSNLLAMCCLEANNKNCGTAGDYTSRCFDKMQKLSGETHDESQKSSIREILGERDKITA